MSTQKDKTETKVGTENVSSIAVAVKELQSWSVERVQEYEKGRKEIINKMLRPGIDYGEVPGTGTLALKKPGIQKLGRFAHFFGMPPVYCKFETTLEEAEPFRMWGYHYIDKKTGEQVSKEARGFYRYRVRCELYTFGGNEFAGSAEGECCSVERGRETALGNTIWQMAKKRAQSQAVTDYTCTSDILTDEEAIEEVKKRDRDDGLPHPLRTMKSKYGSEEKKSNCNFCGNAHILEGVSIVQHPGTESGEYKGLWGAESCYVATFGKPDPEPPGKGGKPVAATESPQDGKSDPIRDSIIKEVSKHERGLAKKDKTFKAIDGRDKYLNERDLSKATDDSLVAYNGFLMKELKQ